MQDQNSRSEHLPRRARRIAGSREGSHKRRRRYCRRPSAAPHGPGGWRHTAHWRTWPGDTSGRVRRTPDAHRLLVHVAYRSSCAGTVRGLHLGYNAGSRAVVYSFSRCHLRRVLPRPLRRERPIPRLHGLGNALVFGPGLARQPLGWTPGGQNAYRLLPATRIQSLRDLLDDKSRRRGDGQQLSVARLDRLRETGKVGGLAERLATTVLHHPI